MARESNLNEPLRRVCARRGGTCIKIETPSQNGFPDWLCLLPGGRAVFVELKRDNQTQPDPLQIHNLGCLTALGFEAYWLGHINAIEEALR